MANNSSPSLSHVSLEYNKSMYELNYLISEYMIKKTNDNDRSEKTKISKFNGRIGFYIMMLSKTTNSFEIKRIIDKLSDVFKEISETEITIDDAAYRHIDNINKCKIYIDHQANYFSMVDIDSAIRYFDDMSLVLDAMISMIRYDLRMRGDL